MFVVVEAARAPWVLRFWARRGPCPVVGRGEALLLGVGRGEAYSLRIGRGVARFQGVGRAEPALQGSDEAEPIPWGSDKVAVASFNRPFDFDRSEPLVPFLQVPDNKASSNDLKSSIVFDHSNKYHV
jgi:hypothetical protein